jgi:hypothetical protein
MVQMNLCSAEHLEVTLLVHYTPGEIEESFLRRAFGEGAQKVWRPVKLFVDPKGRSKYDLLLISRNGFDDFVAFLNSQVHGPASRGILKAHSWQVATQHLDGYFAVLSFRVHCYSFDFQVSTEISLLRRS